MAANYFIKNHVIVTSVDESIPGPDTIATSLCNMVQAGIDSGCITSLAPTFARIRTDLLTTVDARFIGEYPTATVTGTNDEIVTITIPSGCEPLSFTVIGSSSYVDGSDRRTVIFEGNGLPGNNGLDYLNPPTITKVAMPTVMGNPSDSIPYQYDLDNSPGFEIISVGTSSSPSIGIRFTNMAALQNKHLLKFQW